MSIISKVFGSLFAAAVLLVGRIAAAEKFEFTNPVNKNLDQLISSVMGFLFGVALLVCPILIIWGGFMIATSGGDQEKTKKGRQIITVAVVGLVIIALSNVIKAVIWDVVTAK
ncbi:MAG: hypothetical protein WA103_02315 [Minisyncoccales bacterium]